MRARYTRSVGLPVLNEETGEIVGTVSGMLADPDTGVIEGFFVRIPGAFSSQQLFLSRVDILHWGTRIAVRSADVLTPAEDVVRLRRLLSHERPILGQPMITESGERLGTCKDIQFSTTDFRFEWLFPKKLFRWSIPVSASQILEVRHDAIVIRDTTNPSAEKPSDTLGLIPPMPEAA